MAPAFPVRRAKHGYCPQGQGFAPDRTRRPHRGHKTGQGLRRLVCWRPVIRTRAGWRAVPFPPGSAPGRGVRPCASRPGWGAGPCAVALLQAAQSAVLLDVSACVADANAAVVALGAAAVLANGGGEDVVWSAAWRTAIQRQARSSPDARRERWRITGEKPSRSWCGRRPPAGSPFVIYATSRPRSPTAAVAGMTCRPLTHRSRTGRETTERPLWPKPEGALSARSEGVPPACEL